MPPFPRGHGNTMRTWRAVVAVDGDRQEGDPCPTVCSEKINNKSDSPLLVSQPKPTPPAGYVAVGNNLILSLSHTHSFPIP
uniref:Uncharacterized protein n=1 Tax=Setaria italica TaxID=4555 RepID=K3YLE0_SETIT